jgi:hypothetical protein
VFFNHIAHLEGVADLDVAALKQEGVMAVDWRALQVWWDQIETSAKRRKYDIFDVNEMERDDLSKFRRALLWLQSEAYRTGTMTSTISWLADVARADVTVLLRKDKEYGSSWKRRGGVGAFMMMCRKWDRLPQQLERFDGDIARALRTDTRQEGVRDDVGDLRCYLLLIESELTARDLHDRL